LLFFLPGNDFFRGGPLWGGRVGGGGGALLAGRGLFAGPGPRTIAACHLLAAVLVPAEILLVRGAPAWGGLAPGAVPDLLPAMTGALAALAPLGLVLGAQFVLGTRAWARHRADAAHTLGGAYAWETAGFVAGGLLFGLWLVTASEFRTAALAGGLNAAAAAILLERGGWRSALWRRLLLAVAGVVIVLLAGAGQLDRASRAWRHPEQELVATRNSIHGRLTATRIGDQVNFYENGLLLGAAEERMAAEQRVHLPMLWHSDPRRVLLIGTGFNGALGGILQHAPARVEAVELDPWLVEMARPYLAASARRALDDPRVRHVYADARFFLHQAGADGSGETWDVVIVSLPNPATILINRVYTLEFFRAIRRRLAPGGVLALQLAFSPDHPGRELEELGASIHRTLQAVFGSVALLPDYDLVFLAVNGDGPSPTADELAARYRRRDLQTDFVIPPYLRYRLETDRVAQVGEAFEQNATAQLNRDGRPIACHYQFAYWLSSFHPRLGALADRAGRIGWPLAAAALGVVLAVMAWSLRGGAGKHRIGLWAMGTGGFTLMACELVILLSFQVVCGYLYYRLSVLLAAVMLGMAAGTALGTRCIGRATPRWLAGVHLAMAAYALAFAAGGHVLATGGTGAGAWVQAGFYPLAAVIGALAGFECPLAGRLFLGSTGEVARGGRIYAADLAGSGAAALLVGLWAIPVLGTTAVLAGLTALNTGVAILARRQR